jgi:ABC-type transport system substrate-binding protein
MLYTYLITLALTTLALAASGCGGSTKTTSSQTGSIAQATSSTQTTSSPSTAPATATAPLTVAELIAKADPICERANAKRTSITLTTRSSYSRLLPPLVAYERGELAELAKLTPPASLASEWRQILADTKTIIEATAKLGETPPNGRDSSLKAVFVKAGRAERQMLAIAKRIGFKECARLS